MHGALTRILLIGCLGLALPVGAQTGNPFDGDRGAIRAGGAYFASRCSDCHGPDAKGRTGPDLTTIWLSGKRDADVFATIRSGVPNSAMPPNIAPDNEIWAIVAYLKTLGTVPPFDPGPGDAARGQALFAEQCSSCHNVHGHGGSLGPDLSLIASTRSRDSLIESIRDPSAAIELGYRAVSLRTRDGKRVRGAVKAEDAFSIQILDTDERLQGYLKSELRELTREPDSLMPKYGLAEISSSELDDLIAFLATLRLPDESKQ